MTWRIAAWSRETGRGTIQSEHYDGVPFDGANADVDDFRVGELVHVELVAGLDLPQVRRIWPDDPRFPVQTDTRAAPVLRAELRAAADEALKRRASCLDYRLASVNQEAIVIEGDDSMFEYGHLDELVVHDPTYLDLPLRFDVKYFRVSTDAERAHIQALKVDLGEDDLALTLVAESGQFYFAVGRAVSYRRVR
jgi:hypothetical protein